VTDRVPLVESFEARRGQREVRIDVRGLRHILFGTTAIDLTHVAQLVDPAQTRAIGELIHYYATRLGDQGLCLREGVARALEAVRGRGFDVLGGRRGGDLALPRAMEVAAAINRMRSLRIR
jgi:hypothetical protein